MTLTIITVEAHLVLQLTLKGKRFKFKLGREICQLSKRLIQNIWRRKKQFESYKWSSLQQFELQREFC